LRNAATFGLRFSTKLHNVNFQCGSYIEFSIKAISQIFLLCDNNLILFLKNDGFKARNEVSPVNLTLHFEAVFPASTYLHSFCEMEVPFFLWYII